VNIYLRDNSVVLAAGEWKVRLPTCVGSDHNLLAVHNVLFVPNLTKNFLSVSAMAQMGAEICVDKEKCTVIKIGRNIIIGHMLDGKLFVSTPEFLHLLTMSNPPALDIWHQRLGYLNHEYVHQLKRKELLGMKMDRNVPYENIVNHVSFVRCIDRFFQKKGSVSYNKTNGDHTHRYMWPNAMRVYGWQSIYSDVYRWSLKVRNCLLSKRAKLKEYVNLVENQTSCGKGHVMIEVTMEENMPPRDLLHIVQRKELFISLLIPIVLIKMESLRD